MLTIFYVSKFSPPRVIIVLLTSHSDDSLKVKKVKKWLMMFD